MGWHSSPGFGAFFDQRGAENTVCQLSQTFARHGYRQLIIDAGWYADFATIPGTSYAAEPESDRVNIDAHGRLLPSPQHFPDGIAYLADLCHRNGLLIGLELPTGVARAAVEQDLPIDQSRHTMAEIVVPAPHQPSDCWSVPINSAHPGAVDFYRSQIRLLADWGVDLVKAIDFDRQAIEAITSAVADINPNMTIMVSHLADGHDSEVAAQIVQVGPQRWDTAADIEEAFAVWHTASQFNDADSAWFYLGAMPVGTLQVRNPDPEHGGQEWSTADLFGGGRRRRSGLSMAQKRTLVTMHALSRTPLFIGGDLCTVDPYALSLLTNSDMLACNQTAFGAQLIGQTEAVEVWYASASGASPAGVTGWAGVFNRSDKTAIVDISRIEPMGSYQVDVWTGRDANRSLVVAPGDVALVRCSARPRGRREA